MANAARLSSRIDAGLLAGCVVLSLIAVALPRDDIEPVASALAGGLWATFGAGTTFLAGAGFCGLALLGLVFAARRPRIGQT